MDLFVLDQNLEAIAIVDTYNSLIWTDRYQECGDFELYRSISKELLEYIKQDYYLVNNESEHTMIIEKLLINSDPEEGNHITVTGRSLESILERRIIWGLKTISGNLQNGIKTLLEENIISPKDPDRKIDNFVFEESTDPAITELGIDAQYTGDNLYEVIKKICVERGIGFKVTLNDQKQFVFKLYAGVDRSYEQVERPHVVFSPSFDNIIDSNYIESKSSLKNVTLVGGEGEGSERKYVTVGSESGLDRRELFTDARDISSDVGDGKVLTEAESEHASSRVYEVGVHRIEWHSIHRYAVSTKSEFSGCFGCIFPRRNRDQSHFWCSKRYEQSFGRIWSVELDWYSLFHVLRCV